VLAGGIHHVALKVRDLASCERFYCHELGLPVLERKGEGAVWLDAGAGAILMLEQGIGGPDSAPLSDPSAGLHLLAFRIPASERAAWAARLPICGATEYTLYVRDPEGNRIGLSHYPERAPAE
jgi:catechol-2,3-dioxygenase